MGAVRMFDGVLNVFVRYLYDLCIFVGVREGTIELGRCVCKRSCCLFFLWRERFL